MPARTPIYLSLLLPQVKAHTREIIAIGVGTLGLISAHQEQAIFYAQFISYCLTGMACLFTIVSIGLRWNKELKGWRKKNR